MSYNRAGRRALRDHLAAQVPIRAATTAMFKRIQRFYRIAHELRNGSSLSASNRALAADVIEKEADRSLRQFFQYIDSNPYLTAHAAEIAESLMKRGLSQKAAILEAVGQGDADRQLFNRIARRMQKIRKAKKHK